MKKIGIFFIFLSGWLLFGLYIYYDFSLYGSYTLTHLFSLDEPLYRIIFHLIILLTPLMTTAISYFMIQREKLLKEIILSNEERERLIRDLQEALDRVKTFSGFLPICASCKKIRDDKGYWNQIEQYIREHSEAEFTHSYCPECAEKIIRKIKKE